MTKKHLLTNAIQALDLAEELQVNKLSLKYGVIEIKDVVAEMVYDRIVEAKTLIAGLQDDIGSTLK